MTLVTLVRPEIWGDPKVLARSFGRLLRIQRYKHPGGKIEEYSHWHAENKNGEMIHPCMTLPLTTDGTVIAQREFRYGVNKWILEISGGNQKPGATLEDTARGELFEETGYVPGTLTKLQEIVYPSPASKTYSFTFFLATDCTLQGEQKLDYGEYVEVVLIPLDVWLHKIWAGKISDMKTIAITMLALPYLKDKFNIQL